MPADANESALAMELGAMKIVDEKGYKILKLPAVHSHMVEIITTVSNVIDVPPATTRLLLRKFNWNSEKLLMKYGQFGNAGAFVDDTIKIDSSPAPLSSNGNCNICCTYGTLRSFSCNHCTCTSCWKSYIRNKIATNGVLEITCPSNGCGIVLNDEQVSALITERQDSEAFNRRVLNSFVDSSPLLKWCPGRDCGSVAKLTFEELQSVYCDCGAMFCAACYGEAHFPLSCEKARIWKGEEEASVEWIRHNTRSCPGCQVPIERFTVCDHMECSRCRIRFCWLCKGAQHASGVLCVLAPNHRDLPHPITDAVRFNSSFASFQANLRKEVVERRFRENADCFIKRQATGSQDLSNLSHAVGELLQCRRLVTYSHCFIYYLTSTDVSKGQQLVADLEGATDELSKHLQVFRISDSLWISDAVNIDHILMPNYWKSWSFQFYEKSKYASGCRKALLEHWSKCDKRLG